MILNGLEAKPLPIYGDGGNIRDWIYVEDHCRGVLAAFQKGRLGEKYNIGGRSERTNLVIVDTLCKNLEKMSPALTNIKLKENMLTHYSDLKQFVKDRPGHDRRYAIDSSKIEQELGWAPTFTFDSGMEATVRWYVKNLDWCKKIQAGKYERERLGLTQK